jgi:hypothetical protein
MESNPALFSHIHDWFTGQTEPSFCSILKKNVVPFSLEMPISALSW